MEIKVCSSCGVEKTLDQFQADLRYRLGVIGRCKTCSSIYHKVRNQNPDIKAHNKEVRRSRDRKEEFRKYYAKYPEKAKARKDKWLEKNMPRKLAWNAGRRAAKLKATPAWLSAIECAQIQEMYDVAAAKTMQTGIEHHVDHIHPLQGEGFNGLHVPWNLQVLMASENYSKNNSIPSDKAHIFWEKSF